MAAAALQFTVRATFRAEQRRYIQNVTDLEFIVVKIEHPVKALIATIYRPPSYRLDKFLPQMNHLLDSLEMMQAYWCNVSLMVRLECLVSLAATYTHTYTPTHTHTHKGCVTNEQDHRWV